MHRKPLAFTLAKPSTSLAYLSGNYSFDQQMWSGKWTGGSEATAAGDNKPAYWTFQSTVSEIRTEGLPPSMKDGTDNDTVQDQT